MTDPITPERVTLTEDDERTLFDAAWARFVSMPSSNPSDFVHALIPEFVALLSDRLRAAQADVLDRFEALVDDLGGDGYAVQELADRIRRETR